MTSTTRATDTRPGKLPDVASASSVAIAVVGPGPTAAFDPKLSVIVEQVEGAGVAAQRAVGAVADLGGTVEHVPGIIDGFTAEIPAGALAELRKHPGVEAVTPDSTVLLLDKAAGKETNNNSGGTIPEPP
jgi:hypothetical protein